MTNPQNELIERLKQRAAMIAQARARLASDPQRSMLGAAPPAQPAPMQPRPMQPPPAPAPTPAPTATPTPPMPMMQRRALPSWQMRPLNRGGQEMPRFQRKALNRAEQPEQGGEDGMPPIPKKRKKR